MSKIKADNNTTKTRMYSSISLYLHATELETPAPINYLCISIIGLEVEIGRKDAAVRLVMKIRLLVQGKSD